MEKVIPRVIPGIPAYGDPSGAAGDIQEVEYQWRPLLPLFCESGVCGKCVSGKENTKHFRIWDVKYHLGYISVNFKIHFKARLLLVQKLK